MKKVIIGMICDGQAGGVDKHILNFYDSVKSEDCKIDFLTNIPDHPKKAFFNSNGSDIYCISGLNHPVRQYQQARDLFTKENYDIVYMNISTAITYPVIKAAHDAGVKKIIVHSHSSGYDCTNPLKRAVFTCIHKLCKPKICKYATDFLTCSDKAAEWMFVKDICVHKQYQMIYNAVDTEKFRFNEEKRAEIRKELQLENKFVIGNIGNMVYQKNQLFLLDILTEVLKQCDHAHLVIIGDGPLMGQIQEKADLLGLHENISLLGKQDASLGYMSAFDVFALPSNFEGLPIVSVEAQMTSLPCVLSDTITKMASISNMCDFVSTKSVQQWASALLKYKDTDRSDFMAIDGEHFVLSKQKNTFIDILDTENPPPRSARS